MLFNYIVLEKENQITKWFQENKKGYIFVFFFFFLGQLS